MQIVGFPMGRLIWCRGARWPGDRAPNSESRAPGFDPHYGALSCPSARHNNFPEYMYWLMPWKQWLFPDMIEKFLAPTFNLNTNKHKMWYLFSNKEHIQDFKKVLL